MARDRRVLTTGVPETEEETLTAAGVTRTYLATKAPYRDATGAIIGVMPLALRSLQSFMTSVSLAGGLRPLSAKIFFW